MPTLTTKTNKVIQLNFRTSPGVADKLRMMAEEQGRSLSNLVAWILTQAVKGGKDGKYH